MQREHVVRGNVVPIEELDDVVAVMPDRALRSEDVLAPADSTPAGVDAVAADAAQLAAFESAGWIFARPSDRLRRAVDERAAVANVSAVQRVFRKPNGRIALGTDKIAVRLRDDLDETDVRNVLDGHGVEAVKRLRFAPNLFEVRVQPGADFLQVSTELADDDAVVYAEPQFIEQIGGRFHPDDPHYPRQWHLHNTGQLGGTPGADIKAEAAWDTTRGKGVKIAVIDNGFNIGHPDLAPAVEPTSGFFVSEPNGDSVFRNTLAGFQESMGPLNAAGTIFGHGTFCAGMALARAGNGRGGCGVAPEAGLVAIACLGDQVGTQATLARAVAYAADPSVEVAGRNPAEGADIISCSLGPNTADWDMSQTLQDAIDYAVTTGRGGLGTPIFWAVTNGDFPISRDEVCSYPSTIAVGRSTRDDTDDRCGSGPELDFLAGGVDVLSTATDRNGDPTYGVSTGTSFAAPTAAGVGALVLAAHAGLSWQEVRSLLRRTCSKVSGVGYDANGHNDRYGHGRLDAAAAVGAAAGGGPGVPGTASFRQVCDILDQAVGGPEVSIAVHGAFWRGITRDAFVGKKVLGKDVVALGDGRGSNLVRALKGESPFGADLPDPPAGATISRMPTGRPPVPPASIAVIEQWIDAGCPEEAGAPRPATMAWHPTNAPEASSRTDDIWFVGPAEGWAVNSNGQILHTADGGETWVEQFHDEQLYLRCAGFASSARGWVGTLTSGNRLLETDDGGATWRPVTGLPPLAPSAVCGLSVVDANTVYASGTNFPTRPARMMRTVDGGATWTAWEMAPHATILIDTYFTDAGHGWVVGGLADVPNPTRDDVKAVVLRTEDGGATWEDRLASIRDTLPLGEWGWKIHFLDDRIGFVALESFDRAAVLKTSDGGLSWTRLDVVDQQGNANLEGVGFLDETTGWVGGWGSRTFQEGSSSATTDGGKTWVDANEIGRFINRFRFLGDPVTVGYASGRTVYKYSAAPPARRAPSAPVRLLGDVPERQRTGRPLALPIDVPAGARHLSVRIWSRFGEHLADVVDEQAPPAGRREVSWEPQVADGSLIVRVTVDGVSESRIVVVDG
jgi:subtilisin family serine protease/photosystem II stability/assembly factor-like uncharacterized protein